MENELTPTEQARVLLQKEREERVKTCQDEIQAVLDKHHCTLDVSVVLRVGQVIPQVQVIANE